MTDKEHRVLDLAEQIFINAMKSAIGLGNLSDKERIEAFKIASKICLEASDTFIEESEKYFTKDK